MGTSYQKEQRQRLEDRFQARIDDIWQKGTAPKTVSSYESDLRYFWGWAEITHGAEEHYPVDTDLISEFVLDHIEGLSEEVTRVMITSGYKRGTGKLAVKTIEHRLKAIVWKHTKKEGLHHPIIDNRIKICLSDAKKAEIKAGRRERKSRAIVKPMLDRMYKTFGPGLKDTRDKAILAFGFYTGGRRRSEIAEAHMDYLKKTRGGYEYTVYRSKTDQRGEGHMVPLRSMHAKPLRKWLKDSAITEGFIFRVLERGQITDRPVSGASINHMIKRRIEVIGEDPVYYSAHGIRRGFITECGRQGISLQDAMAMSLHRDIRVAMKYHEEGRAWDNPATRL